MLNVLFASHFNAPTDAQRASIRVGDHVLIGYASDREGRPAERPCQEGVIREQFYVFVTKVEWPWFEGTIDNVLIRTGAHGLCDEMLVGFEARHILHILPAEDRHNAASSSARLPWLQSANFV